MTLNVASERASERSRGDAGADAAAAAVEVGRIHDRTR